MPKPNNTMFIRNGLNTMLIDFKDKLDKAANKKAELGYSGLEQLLANLQKLMAEEIKLFGSDGKKEPTLKQRTDFATLCSNCIAGLETIKSYSTNADIKDKDIQDIGAYISDNFADKIALELKPFTKVKQPPHDWKFTEEENQAIAALLERSKKAIEPKLNERVENQSQEYSKPNQTRWVEFPDAGPSHGYSTGDIRQAYQLTNDINDLAAFYLRKENITKDEKDYIERRIGTILHYNELEKKGKSQPPKPVFKTTGTSKSKSFGLTGYEGKYQYQTTINGCWSCAYAMLLESRGVSLNQQMVRLFRPNIGAEEAANLAQKPVQGLTEDREFSPIELADLTNKVLPSTSLRQVVLQATDPEDLKDVKKQFVETLKEALLVQKSPVALNKNNHFVTIVGVEGDNLKVLNSRSNNIDLVDTIKIDDVVNTKKFSLTWLHDLKFTKDGKCNNMPKEFEGIHYSEGKLLNQSTVVDPLNKSGSTFASSRLKGKVFIQDSMYVPDSVPEAVYKLEAEANKLNEEDDAYKNTMKVMNKRCDAVKTVLLSTDPADTEKRQTRTAAYIAHRIIMDEVKKTGKEKYNPSLTEKMSNLMSKSYIDKKFNEVKNSVAMRKILPTVPSKIDDGKKLDEIYTSYKKEQKKFIDTASQSVTRAKISSEITKQHENIKKIVENWDSIKNPIDKLRLTVATMLAKRTLLDAFDNTNDPDKEKNFEKIRKNPGVITDISESESFKDFYLNIKSEEILKLCECKPEDRELVEDKFYRKFVESLSKPRKAKEEKTEQKEIENPEIKKSIK